MRATAVDAEAPATHFGVNIGAGLMLLHNLLLMSGIRDHCGLISGLVVHYIAICCPEQKAAQLGARAGIVGERVWSWNSRRFDV